MTSSDTLQVRYKRARVTLLGVDEGQPLHWTCFWLWRREITQNVTTGLRRWIARFGELLTN